MQESNLTARQLFVELKSKLKPQYGFGSRPAIVNVDLQRAYTSVGEFSTAYETHPKQMEYVNHISDIVRQRRLPVVWTYVAFFESAEDCGVFGQRTDTENSVQNIKLGSPRAELDPRLDIREADIVLNKKMPSAFHETFLQSLFVYHRIDTVIVTGGSTSGCVRATVVDSLSRGYRTIVPEECVADLHESPHFANLYDIHKKYGDVVAAQDVIDFYGR